MEHQIIEFVHYNEHNVHNKVHWFNDKSQDCHHGPIRNGVKDPELEHVLASQDKYRNAQLDAICIQNPATTIKRKW